MSRENTMNDLQRQKMNIVIVGHVDHGKSTVIGRLLADTHTLPEGKLEQVKANCERNSKPFEYAFLIDALKDEQAQGITIDAARVFFKTAKRDYIIIDAPGHIEFLKNMITGASRAEAALLVIDAHEGVQENSRRHGYMLSMLGIRQICVLVNKMDLVGYDQKVFDGIVAEYGKFLDEIGIRPTAYIPVSGRFGDNLVSHSDNMKWFSAKTVLEQVDDFKLEEESAAKPFRMPVQGVYKFTKFGDERRIVAGTVDSGSAKAGDTVVFYPSGKRSKIKTFEAFNREPPAVISAGEAAGFTTSEQIYVTRGEIAAVEGQPQPQVSSRLRVSLFWLNKKPMIKKKDYLLKLGAAKVPARLEEVVRVIDASDLSAQGKTEQIDRHDVADCVLKLGKPLAFDKASDSDKTSRFVIVDEYEIAGGGIIHEGLEERGSWTQDNALVREYRWETSSITSAERELRYRQRAAVVIVTGEKDTGKKKIVKQLENKLFGGGYFVYSVVMGENSAPDSMKRLTETAHILMDAGLIVIVSAHGLKQDDLEIVKGSINPDRIETVWVGDEVTTDIAFDVHIDSNETPDDAVAHIVERLQNTGVIYKPRT